MRPPMIMHITYCEQGQTIEEVCRKARAWGFDGVEFRRRREGVAETQESYLAQIEKGVRATRLRYVLFGSPGPDLVNPDPAVRRREVDEAVAFYRLVSGRFGTRTVNLFTGALHNPDKAVSYYQYTRHGSFIATPEQWAAQVQGVRDLADGVKDLSIRCALETHMACLHDTVEATMRLVREVDRPSVGVNLDYANLTNFEEKPTLEQALQATRGHLHYVHLKNMIGLRGAPGRFVCGLGDGEINNRHFLRLLRDDGYEGPLALEGPRAGDRERYAPQDLAYALELLKDLGMS